MAADKPSPVDELRRRVRQPGPWAERLRQLAEDIAAVDDDLPSATESVLTCAEVDAILDVIVDDDLADRPAEQSSSRTAAHLKACARCRQTYALFLDTLVAERAKELTSIPVPARPNLSFLQPPATDRPWITRLRSALTGEAFGLTISLNAAYLQRLFFSPAPLLVRADEAPTTVPAAQLLLSDAIMLGDQLLAIELTAQRDPLHADEVVLQAVITSSTSLPPNLWAALSWAGERQQSPVDVQGQVNLGRVSLRALQTATHDFELVVETRPELYDSPHPIA